MDDPLAIIYENNMLRGIGAALTLGASPLAAKDTVKDYKKAAVQTAEYIKTFDKQIPLTHDSSYRVRLEKQKNIEKERLINFIQKLRDMGVSDDEIKNLSK
jgi:hypothetical protein